MPLAARCSLPQRASRRRAQAPRHSTAGLTLAAPRPLACCALLCLLGCAGPGGRPAADGIRGAHGDHKCVLGVIVQRRGGHRQGGCMAGGHDGAAAAAGAAASPLLQPNSSSPQSLPPQASSVCVLERAGQEGAGTKVSAGGSGHCAAAAAAAPALPSSLPPLHRAGMNLTSGLERWDPYSLWGVVTFGLLLGGSLLVGAARAGGRPGLLRADSSGAAILAANPWANLWVLPVPTSPYVCRSWWGRTQSARACCSCPPLASPPSPTPAAADTAAAAGGRCAGPGHFACSPAGWRDLHALCCCGAWLVDT